jgi:hypothetical protein
LICVNKMHSFGFYIQCSGVYNCNIVAPLSAVEIPIGRPPPPTPSPPPHPTPAPRSHYEDPENGCLSDETALTEKVTGFTGTFCSPQCATRDCPTDVPPGVTAKPTCFTVSSSGSLSCFLVCTPGSAGDKSCGANASCKEYGVISGTGGSGAYYDTGVCTYDDDSSASALALNTTFIAKQ